MKPNKTKKSILEFLSTHQGAFYGDLVMGLDEDTLTILENLIALKKMGLVYKDDDGGRFRINEDYDIKRTAGTGKASRPARRKKPTAAADPAETRNALIREMNEYSEDMHEKNKKKDQAEPTINKQVPREQRVKRKK